MPHKHLSAEERLFIELFLSQDKSIREIASVERTRAGLTAARLQGRIGGRKRKMTDSKIESARKLMASGVSPKEVAENLGVSIPTLYRWLPASVDHQPSKS